MKKVWEAPGCIQRCARDNEKTDNPPLFRAITHLNAACGLHARLGAGAPLSRLPWDLVEKICRGLGPVVSERKIVDYVADSKIVERSLPQVYWATLTEYQERWPHSKLGGAANYDHDHDHDHATTVALVFKAQAAAAFARKQYPAAANRYAQARPPISWRCSRMPSEKQ